MQPQPPSDAIPELDEIERAFELDDVFLEDEPDTLRCPVPDWGASLER